MPWFIRFYLKIAKKFGAEIVNEAALFFKYAKSKNIIGITGTKGKYVPLKETIRGFKEVVEGKYDNLPEQAFYMVGGIEEVVEKAKQMGG